MDSDRYSEWIRVSHAVGGVEQYRAFIVAAIQGLARLDCQLIAADEEFLQVTEQQRATIPVSVSLSEGLTLSYLWVLGAYEILRTLDRRKAEASSRTPCSVAGRIKVVKDLFKRVRIPLAKFEFPNDHKSTCVAYPGINPVHGVGWLIADNTFVSRRELSDAFLDLLSDLRLVERE